MRWVRLAVLAGGGLLVARSAHAQGKMGLRLLVANPYSSAAADSAPAVQIGGGIREQLADFMGNDYRVVTQVQMNDALNQYGYPTDAILSPTSAAELAKYIDARVVITGMMGRADNGQVLITSRVVGRTDSAGYVFSVVKQPVEALADYGRRIADSLQPALKSLLDAKECFELSELKPDKALKAAEKALKRVPDHGLAHLCLYEFAKRQNAPAEERIKHLEAITRGDPLSVFGWRELANTYIAVNDTAKTLAAAQQLLRVAPTNQELRQRVINFFLTGGHWRLALDAANEGVTMEPASSGLHYLRATACLNLRDFACTLDALQASYAADSNTTDSVFFLRAVYAAVQLPDTTQLLRWAQTGVQKFAGNLDLLDGLRTAYLWTNQTDSIIVVTRQIIERDTTRPMMAAKAVQLLLQAKRVSEIEPFVNYVERYGGAESRNQLASLLTSVAVQRLRGDSSAGVSPDLASSIQIARRAMTFADSTSDVFVNASYVLGISLLSRASNLDGRIDSLSAAAAACDSVRLEQEALAESKIHFARVAQRQGTNPTQAQTYLTTITDTFEPRVKDLLKRHCP